MTKATDKSLEEKKQMMEAIRLGRVQEVMDRVQADPAIIHHIDRSSGLTLLQRAAFHGQVPIATYLLDHGAVTHIDSSPPHPTCNRKIPSALYLAALKGHADMIQLLISRGADPNLGTEVGTPLMAASARGWVEVVRCLLKHRLGRAGVNLANKCGQTALWLACREGREEVVWDLLDAGADMRMGPPGGPTAVAVALAHGQGPCAMVWMKWLERRAEMTPDHDDATALPGRPTTSTSTRAHLSLPPPSLPGLGSKGEYEAFEHGGALSVIGRGLKRAREEEEGEDVNHSSRLPRHRTIPSSFYSIAPSRSTASFTSSCSGSSTPPLRPVQSQKALIPSSSSASRSPSSPSPISPDPHNNDEEEAADALSRLREWQKLSYSESSHVLGKGGRPSPPPCQSSPGGSSTRTTPLLAAQSEGWRLAFAPRVA